MGQGGSRPLSHCRNTPTHVSASKASGTGKGAPTFIHGSAGASTQKSIRPRSGRDTTKTAAPIATARAGPSSG